MGAVIITYVTGEAREAKRGEVISPRSPASQWQSQNWNLGRLAPGPGLSASQFFLPQDRRNSSPHWAYFLKQEAALSKQVNNRRQFQILVHAIEK